MKRTGFTILAVLATFSLNAQLGPTFDGKQADKRSLGIYTLYPQQVNKQVIEAPKGYKEVYISHYGRHGSRYILSNREYDVLHEVLVKAHTDAMLTEKGINLYERYEKVYPRLRGRAQELTPKGFAQQRGIAGRMFSSHPAIFKGKKKIIASSTQYERTALSMAVFANELTRLNPALDISMDASIGNIHINPHVVANERYGIYEKFIHSPLAPGKALVKEYFDANIDYKSFTKRIFKDYEYALANFDVKEFMTELYYLTCCEPNTEEEQVGAIDCFTKEEFDALGLWDNYFYYMTKGDYPLFKGNNWAMIAPTLEDIVDKAESDINGGISARLRFGHDGCIMMYNVLTQQGNWAARSTNPADIAKFWDSSAITMANNFQFIFYRNRQGNLIFRYLVNEKECKLAIPSIDGIFYNWSDFKEFAAKRLETANIIMNQSDNINVCGFVKSEGKPIEGVQVSDGYEIVRTNAIGYYEFTSFKTDSLVYITTPSGYIAKGEDPVRPGFWKRLSGDANVCERHDFELEPQNQNAYMVLFPTDMHLSKDPRRNDLERFKKDVLPYVQKRADAANAEGLPVYSFNLGDFTHELYWYELGFNEEDGVKFLLDCKYPTPTYMVSGNHDNDGAIVGEDTDRRAAWLQRRMWGPGQYSVNIGADHWIFLDNIIYNNIPGKGKKAPGIRGDRSYDTALTCQQIEWLKKDLQSVTSDTRVYICMHCPALRSIKASGISIPEEQAQLLNELASRFCSGFSIFSGHIHQFDICDNPRYPNLFQYGLPATSGSMWENIEERVYVSDDGSASGLWEGKFVNGKAPEYNYGTFDGSNPILRIYDMNEVGKVYAKDEGVRQQQKLFPDSRANYADKKYRNYIYVNYWAWKPGDTVSISENGKALEVERGSAEDPTYNFSYELPIITGINGRSKPHPKYKVTTKHFFKAKASEPNSTVTITVLDKDGNKLYEENFSRPAKFTYSR